MAQMELTLPLQMTGQKLHHLWSVPKSVPRQKTYTYLILIVITSVLIYFYSYPLTIENWTQMKVKMMSSVIFSRKEFTDAPDAQATSTERTVTQADSVFLRALFNKENTTFVKSKQVMVKNITGKLTNTFGETSNDLPNQTTRASIKESVKSTTSAENSKYSLIQSTKMSAFETTEELNDVDETSNEIQRDSTEITDDLETQNFNDYYTNLLNVENGTSEIQKGYLVFSEHCRIPDIDPWDTSILKFVEKSPPLDCSENHKPLTRTKGNNILILDEAATLQRTDGGNYTCCYHPVFRIHDGKTDNDVGYSECINMSHETIVEDEFIYVNCKNQSETFYEEFHSFIFDKPEVEERCNKANQSLYSVLLIGVDSVSRMNMHRQLNATANYLLKEMDAIEMHGYNKVGDNTFPNLIPLMTGYDERELPDVCWKSERLPLDNCTLLWKHFAEKGYRTFYAEDSPHISTFNYMKKGFHHQPTDYYFRPFIMAYENKLGRDKPLNCYQCVGSISETEAVLNWAEQFALHFMDRPYFAFSWINSLTHDFLNMGSAGDNMYEKFFRTLHQRGALQRTIVILISDHGMRWGEIRNTYVGRLEARLPMLMIALPPRFKEEYPNFSKVLRENSHRLVTPYDLHATLKHLLNLTNNWTFENTDDVGEDLSLNFTTRAQSLFTPVPKGRSCDDAYIEEHWCTCENSMDVDIQSEKVKQIVTFLLERINKLLKPVSKKCALLELDSILDARLWQPTSEHAGHSINDDIYTVVIKTNPSEAVFEGTVKISKPATYKLLGTISRLNLYRDQSSCVHNAILKKYCYCL